MVNLHISVTTLIINGLNSQIKRHKVEVWITKQDPTICCLQETLLNYKDKHRLKGAKMILKTNGNQREVGVAVLI